MTRTLTMTKEIGDAPYASNDRVFNRITLSISVATNITANVFVVDTLSRPGQSIPLYVATPADLEDIPDDEPNDEGLLRVDTIVADYDNEQLLTEFITSMEGRLTLLLETLAALEASTITDTFTVTA